MTREIAIFVYKFKEIVIPLLTLTGLPMKLNGDTDICGISNLIFCAALISVLLTDKSMKQVARHLMTGVKWCTKGAMACNLTGRLPLERVSCVSSTTRPGSSSGANGRLFAGSIDGKSVGVEHTKTPGYRINVEKAREGDVWVGDVMKLPASGRPASLIKAPIYADGKYVGMMGTPVELRAFSREFIGNVTTANMGYPYIVVSRSETLAHPDRENILKVNISDFDFGKQIFSKKKWTGI